jgi:hypothetical protein
MSSARMGLKPLAIYSVFHLLCYVTRAFQSVEVPSVNDMPYNVQASFVGNKMEQM